MKLFQHASPTKPSRTRPTMCTAEYTATCDKRDDTLPGKPGRTGALAVIGPPHFNTRILMLRNPTSSPWFCSAMPPVAPVANTGQRWNLLAATRALNCGDPIS